MENRFIPSVNLFPDGFFVQKHAPIVMAASHVHSHVEILLTIECAVHFNTHAGPALARPGQLNLLWAQLPHQVTQIEGEGHIYVANVPLQEWLNLGIQEEVIERLLSGHLISADTISETDPMMFESWLADYESQHPAKIELARTELDCRIKRQCLDGWKQPGAAATSAASGKANRQIGRIHKMIRYMAEHYTQPITIADIANAGGVSQGYAMTLFQKTLNLSIKTYLNRLRLYHAKSALLATDEKILTIAMDSGFGSLSRFYEIFALEEGQPPQAYRQAGLG